MKEIFEQWAPLIIAAAAIVLLVGIVTNSGGFITQQFNNLIQNYIKQPDTTAMMVDQISGMVG